MVFETLEKSYTVLRNLRTDESSEQYVCRDEENGREYVLTRFRDKDFIVKTLAFLTDQVNNRDFTDMVSCFFCEDCLFVVMRYSQGITMSEQFSTEALPLKERMMIGRRILDQLLLQHMPNYFMREVLNEETICVTKTMEARFLYGLNNLESYKDVKFNAVTERIAALMKRVFEKEIHKKTVKPAEEFIRRLEDGEFTDIMSVYRAYDDLMKLIGGFSPKDLEVPKTWIFRAWDKFKRTWPVIRRVLATALLIGSIVFLILTISNNGDQGEEQKVFKTIGTLDIK
ncbi:MAG: hypothetical protein J5819_05095 [Eubacterium sp.]|nr:hypothetical protein [Eubacterium sp.]